MKNKTLREQIAKYLHGLGCHNQALWDKATQDYRDVYLMRADKIIAIVESSKTENKLEA